MFTGIVQAVGKLEALEPSTLAVSAPESFRVALQLGESIAVDGCCLTLAGLDDAMHFDLSPETRERTTFGSRPLGSGVNLERAMLAAGRFGGHFVQGHIDTVGTVVSISPREGAVVYRFAAPPEYDRFLIDKGSIAIDGISLTVVDLEAGQFDVWVIPSTLEGTNLRERQPGDRVNMEFDMIARYVEKLTKLNR